MNKKQSKKCHRNRKMQKKLSKKKNTKKFSQYKRWSFGTLNIRTGKENDNGAKIYSIAKEMSKTDMQFMLLQEVRWRGIGSKIIELDTGDKFEFHWSGYKRKREAGVGILIRINKNIEINTPDYNEPRVMGIDLKVYGFNLRIINVYSPTECAGTEEQKRKFYSDIKKASKTNNKNQKLIVAGDFNATTEVAKYKSNFNGKKIVLDHHCNDNGERLKHYCRFQDLSISSSFFKHRLLHRYTWYSNDKKTRKILDYILTESYVQRYMTDCRVYRSFDVETDHRLLKATMHAPTTKNGRKRFCKNPTQPSTRLNIKEFQNKQIQEHFTNQVDNKLRDNRKKDRNIMDRSKNLIDILSETAAESLPIKQRNPNNNEIFKDDETLNKLLERRSMHSKGTQAHKSVTKMIKKRVKFIRNQKLLLEAEQINHHATRRETEELFRKMKADGSSFQPIRRNNKCDPAKLKEYFSNHFSFDNQNHEDAPIELNITPEYIKILQNVRDDINHAPPNTQEIKEVLKSLKNGKASTDVPSEFFKYASDSNELQLEIHHIFSEIWKTHTIPTIWTHSKLVALWKGASKGSASDPKAYRGLQVGTVLCKILVITILNRIKPWYDQTLLDQQQGFRSGRGTADGIFITKRIQQISDSMKKPVYVLFVDLSSAFDHVNRSWLFKSIQQRFTPDQDTTLFQILQAVYHHTTTALAETPDEIFEISIGVRQGGPESPMLYNLYMDYVMRVFEHVCSEENIEFIKLNYRIRTTSCTREERMHGYFGDHIVNWSGYADDIELFFENLDDIRKGIITLHSIFKRFGLNINIKKTKSMILNFNFTEDQAIYPQSIIQLENKAIENVKNFRYLGDEINFDEPSTGNAEIDLRISIAEAKFYEIIKRLTNFNIHLKTRVLLLNTIVRSRLTYSCQTWNLNQVQMNRINSCYVGMLRKLVRNGSKREEDYRYLITNDQILQICQTEDIPTFVAKQQASYLGHLARQSNQCLTKKLLFNANRRIKSGRPVETLEDKVIKYAKCTKDQFYKDALSRKRHDHPSGSDRRLSSRR